MQSGDPLSDSQLRYTMNFLGLGRISTDITGVPVAQLGKGGETNGRETVREDIIRDVTDIFIP